MADEPKRRAPRVLNTARIAKLFGDGWTTKMVRTFLKNEGIGKKVGRRYIVTATELRCAMSSIATEIEVAAAEGLD